MPSSPNFGRIIEIGETCGIEYESDYIVAQNLPDSLRVFWRQTHDASIESDKFILNSGLIVENTKNKIVNFLVRSGCTVGTEFTSVILKASESLTLEVLKRFTDYLGENGHLETSERSGIHFHISLPNPTLSILKSILKMGSNLESLFFTLGGMGYNFRGEKNDSIYCRPITQNGPTFIPYYHGGYVKCFEINRLLETKNQEEFWENYGDLKTLYSRYQPVRYSWLNLYPMCPWGEYKGTLEFRVFNTTLNPYYIFAVLNLCKLFTEYAITNSKDIKFSEYLGENSIFNIENKGQIKKILEISGEFLKIEDNIYYILEDIVNASPIPKLNNENVFSHLLFSRRSGMPSYFFKNIPDLQSVDSTQIIKPKFVDVHVLRGEI